MLDGVLPDSRIRRAVYDGGGRDGWSLSGTRMTKMRLDDEAGADEVLGGLDDSGYDGDGGVGGRVGVMCDEIRAVDRSVETVRGGGAGRRGQSVLQG